MDFHARLLTRGQRILIPRLVDELGTFEFVCANITCIVTEDDKETFFTGPFSIRVSKNEYLNFDQVPLKLEQFTLLG